MVSSSVSVNLPSSWIWGRAVYSARISCVSFTHVAAYMPSIRRRALYARACFAFLPMTFASWTDAGCCGGVSLNRFRCWPTRPLLRTTSPHRYAADKRFNDLKRAGAESVSDFRNSIQIVGAYSSITIVTRGRSRGGTGGTCPLQTSRRRKWSHCFGFVSLVGYIDSKMH